VVSRSVVDFVRKQDIAQALGVLPCVDSAAIFCALALCLGSDQSNSRLDPSALSWKVFTDARD